MKKMNIFGMSLADLGRSLSEMGQKPFRAKQILPWLYAHKVTSFSQMTNLSLALREELEDTMEIRLFKGMTRTFSEDGSIKYLFECLDGAEIESVYMPMQKGHTLCISSQVGCAQGCTFCMTGTMGFIRNLTPGEMLAQVWSIVVDQKLEYPFNIVMMGMGEPLLNMKNLEVFLELMFSPLGFDHAPRRVTVSTSGHVTHIRRLGNLEQRPRLAVSLNATTNEQRDSIMPVNRQWPIGELLEACRNYPLGSRDRITFEYVVFRDLNDSPEDARRLVKLLMGIRCKVNLIPFNETPELSFRESPVERLEVMREILSRSGVRNTIRWSKGRDIGAACGQLVSQTGERGARRV